MKMDLNKLNKYGKNFDEQESVVDFVFPSLGYNKFDPEFEIQKYSAFGFWRETFSDYNLTFII